MSVLRSLLTAGVLASGLLWSLNGITATPAAQASDDRYEVTQQRNPDAACLDCHKPDTEGMHGKHASVINPNNKLLGHLHQLSRPAITATPRRGERCDAL